MPTVLQGPEVLGGKTRVDALEFRAGEALEPFDIVRLSNYDGRQPTLVRASAAAASTCAGQLFIVTERYASGEYGLIRKRHAIELDTSASSIGATVYLSDVGRASLTPGTLSVVIGQVLSVAVDGYALVAPSGSGSGSAPGGSGWTDDGVNVRLTTATDTVSVGTNTAPAAGVRMGVQADVAPAGVGPSIAKVVSLDANVTGVTTALTGVGLAMRAENDAGTMTELGSLWMLYTDPANGAESASGGVFMRYLGAAPGLVFTYGPDGIGVFDVTTPSFTPQASLNSDKGGSSPTLNLGDGTNPQDWHLTRIGAELASIDGLSLLKSLYANQRDVTTTPYAVVSSDLMLLCDPTAASIVVDLPSVASVRGRILIIAHSSASANSVSVTPNGGDTIDLVAGANVLSSQQTLWLIASPTGANWKII